VISLLDLGVERPRDAMMLELRDRSPAWGICPEELRVFYPSPRWEPDAAGLNSHRRAHRDPKISLGEVEVPRWPQGCNHILVDQETKQSQTNECQRQSMTIGRQAGVGAKF